MTPAPFLRSVTGYASPMESAHLANITLHVDGTPHSLRVDNRTTLTLSRRPLGDAPEGLRPGRASSRGPRHGAPRHQRSTRPSPTPPTARHAAALVRVEYDAAEHDTELRADHPGLYTPEARSTPDYQTDTADGDVETALRDAAVTVDATYTTPHEHNNPMEPHACIAIWDPTVPG